MLTAAFAAAFDPDRNALFRQRWTEPPPRGRDPHYKAAPFDSNGRHSASVKAEAAAHRSIEAMR
jgi:hypothetical protein